MASAHLVHLNRWIIFSVLKTYNHNATLHECVLIQGLSNRAHPLRVKNLSQQAHQMTIIYPSMQKETLRVKTRRMSSPIKIATM